MTQRIQYKLLRTSQLSSTVYKHTHAHTPIDKDFADKDFVNKDIEKQYTLE